MRNWLAVRAVVLTLACGVMWLAGEQHKDNCQQAGRVSCSVLPWDEGQKPDGSFDFETAR